MARLTAAERREQVVGVALTAFSMRGYAATSTTDIADAAGVSQPYLFRLFPGKMALFVAAWTRCCDRIENRLETAADEAYGPSALEAMAEAYDRLLAEEPELLNMQLQAWAASALDTELRRDVGQRFQRMWDLVAARAGAGTPDVTTDFMATWTLYNVASALGIDAIRECRITSMLARSESASAD